MPPDKYGNQTFGELWEENVETPVAQKFDENRAGKTPEELREYDTNVGAAKGVYHFAKSTLTGLVDVAMYATNMLAMNPETWAQTRDTAWSVMKGLARETYIAYFGSPEEVQDQNERFLAVPKAMYGAFMSEWEKAKASGKQDEFVARYTVQGILEIASLFIGIGELKALGKAGAANEIIHDASIVAKCPKLLAKEKAAAEAAKAIKKGMSLEEAAKAAGMTEEAAAQMMKIAREEGVVIKMRPTNEDSLKWIKEGHPRKPESIKAKTMTKDDIALGAPAGSEGLVWHKKPVLPPGTTDPKTIARYEKRLAEFEQNNAKMQELVDKGKITITDDGLVIDTKTGKAITGDHDPFSVTMPDGSEADAATKARVAERMAEAPIDAQHGAHMDWKTKTPEEQKIKDGIIEGHRPPTEQGQKREPLVEFGPDGASQTYAD
jgi:hypothetical protein